MYCIYGRGLIGKHDGGHTHIFMRFFFTFSILTHGPAPPRTVLMEFAIFRQCVYAFWVTVCRRRVASKCNLENELEINFLDDKLDLYRIMYIV